MSLPVKWYDEEHTIIQATIAKDTTWEDYHKAIDWIIDQAQNVSYRIDLIFLDDVGMPAGNPMSHLKRGSTRVINQANIRLTVLAGSHGYSGFSRMTLEILAKAYSYMSVKKGQLLFARDLDEALSIIEKDRVQQP